ncbi:ZIP family metal transporter [Bordetella bronchialis]|uniref:Divalent cation transporter n=1 Tax=Bordetella bronchialis TaxID=463025 RepID=A0A193FDU5_9BORD|nr:ZIP family metal transporter [Bordetella bronchialis]ANN65319.1 divalent cation transporter [Bordetella bronchialis]ANN70351.1 divalent cation transporter [Bordetella bronchialis]
MNTHIRSLAEAGTGKALVLVAMGIAGLGAWWLWVGLHDDYPRVADAWLGGLIAAGATAAGTLPVLFSQRLSERVQDTMFGFGAGVMLAASAFSLVAPGIEAARNLGAGPWSAGLTVGAGILLGAAALLWLEHTVPHEHFIKGREGHDGRMLKRTWLFVFAVMLHNLPEGLAIGVAFGGTDTMRAGALATGIAIQDVPEGLVIAVALLAAGYGRGFSVLLGMVSGLIEPIGALAGAAVMAWSAVLLPWGLGFAAGAMLFVISHEIIPESHRKGHEVYATGGLMIGFVLMMLLDTALA